MLPCMTRLPPVSAVHDMLILIQMLPALQGVCIPDLICIGIQSGDACAPRSSLVELCSTSKITDPDRGCRTV